MIVASFQSEYGIRLSSELANMSWREFSYFINGFGGDTPLGRIVSIRAENDPEQLKHFTPEQKRIRNEYRRKKALTKTDKEVDSALDQMKNALLKMVK